MNLLRLQHTSPFWSGFVLVAVDKIVAIIDFLAQAYNCICEPLTCIVSTPDRWLGWIWLWLSVRNMKSVFSQWLITKPPLSFIRRFWLVHIVFKVNNRKICHHWVTVSNHSGIISLVLELLNDYLFRFIILV